MRRSIERATRGCVRHNGAKGVPLRRIAAERRRRERRSVRLINFNFIAASLALARALEPRVHFPHRRPQLRRHHPPQLQSRRTIEPEGLRPSSLAVHDFSLFVFLCRSLFSFCPCVFLPFGIFALARLRSFVSLFLCHIALDP